MYVYYLLLLFRLSSWTSAEIFTAISDIEPLLDTHKRILDDLNDYIGKEEKRLKALKKQLDIYRRENYKAMQDIPNYLGNPINAFTLIKRLTIDLDLIKNNIIIIGSENLKNASMNHDDVKYPMSEDLVGAAQALTRLQQTYHLHTEELAEGMLNGVTYSYPMSIEDCYELGRVLYDEKDFENSLNWMKIAYKKFKAESQDDCRVNESQILNYTRLSLYMLGDIKEALVWTELLLELDPNNTQVQSDIVHYKDVISNEDESNGGDNVVKKKTENPNEIYESLCRGEMDIASEIAKILKCRYVTENHPFLRYAPIKMEEMFIDPTVLIFHDVISNSEIEFVQKTAQPRFKRALVRNSETGEGIPIANRISKSAWLSDNESPIIAQLSRRVADMTGLDETHAEELQVANYGIGGHYAPHFDFRRRFETEFPGQDNRIATVLFYMSDVAQGGATVFPELGLTLFPEKGAAAFWINLHPSGQGDLATKHAACPVLRGSKWVCNKWLHQKGQELKKPCNLEYQDEAILRKIPSPTLKNFK